jgi:chaperonin GroEL (HSP60 family)
MEKIIQGIVDAGVKCVIVGGSVSNNALQYLDHYKIMIIRIMSKFEIRRIASSIGATMLVRLVYNNNFLLIINLLFRVLLLQKKSDMLIEFTLMK